MITTKNNYSASVNLKRDNKNELAYITTPNGKNVFNDIIGNYNKGIRSFNIVGAYGTGKSSFLLAFQKSLTRSKLHFGTLPEDLNKVKFDVINIVGEYNSIVEIFAENLNINNKKNLRVKDIFNKLDLLTAKNKGLIICVDEFGKFLEYAADNDPSFELYFLQQLAEYTNDTSKNILLLTALHQDFNGYSYSLTALQRNEWSKVSGRFREISFNEPVEQLLYLASKRIFGLNVNKVYPKTFGKLFQLISHSNSFPLKSYLDEETAAALYPLDILSAAVLTVALQKYGQNERSLFTFLEANSELSLFEHNYKESPYYGLNKVYDYLVYNHFSYISSKSNPDYSKWYAIKIALERVEGIFVKDIDEIKKIIKAIGLLSLFSSGGAKLDQKFLESYCTLALNMLNCKKLISLIEKNKIAKYSKYSGRYILTEGTDLDIELAINAAGQLVERISNPVHYLEQNLEMDYIPAKAIYFERGTPRLFKFKLSEEPMSDLMPQHEIDGYINLILSDKIAESKIIEISKNTKQAIVYCYYKDSNEIKNSITEIEKIKKVISDNLDDKIAKRELEIILLHQNNLLNHYLENSLFSGEDNIAWYYKGKKIDIQSKRDMNIFISRICREIYYKTPVYHNELVNKTKLSGQVSMARKKLIDALLNNWHSKDLGLAENKFPPEKSIYLSLLLNTGIHKNRNNVYYLDPPTDENFKVLWQDCEKFLRTASHARKSINELVNILSKEPYKLKKGFLDFWIPVFMIIKKDEYALYLDESFIPELSINIFDLINKTPRNFYIKSFAVDGIRLEIFNKYRELINKNSKDIFTKTSFIETIKPFLIFYKNLSEYSKNTKRISKNAIAVRNAIAKSKDPEKTFFEDLPNSLGYSLGKLNNKPKEIGIYIKELQNSIAELRTNYDELINRTYDYINSILYDKKSIKFEALTESIRNRYIHIKQFMLLPYQKTFYLRLIADNNDKVTWISSISNALLNKPLNTISDNEEEVLFEKLSVIFKELDNLIEITNLDNDLDIEEIVKIDISAIGDPLRTSFLRYPKNKKEKINSLKKKIKKLLSEDNKINSAALFSLLKDNL